jgi:hypothetical protein
VTFGLMNVIAMGIAVACLAVSHDVLHFTSTLADNISGNVIGIGLGTLFRFWAYRTFVFTQLIDPQGRDRAEDARAEPLGPEAPDAARPVPLAARRTGAEPEAVPDGHPVGVVPEPGAESRAAG